MGSALCRLSLLLLFSPLYSTFAQDNQTHPPEHVEKAPPSLIGVPVSKEKIEVGRQFAVLPNETFKQLEFHRAYQDLQKISFPGKYSVSILENSVQSICLQCRNRKDIFRANPKENICPGDDNVRKNLNFLFSNPTEHQPCQGGDLLVGVHKANGSGMDCYCGSEDHLVQALKTGLVPVPDDLIVKLYDKSNGKLLWPNPPTDGDLLHKLPGMEGRQLKILLSQPAKSGEWTSGDIYGENGEPLSSAVHWQINPRTLPASLTEPAVARTFMESRFTRQAPCNPRERSIPRSLLLPSLTDEYFNMKGFGEGVSYRLVDETLIPPGLRMSTGLRADRTGYARRDNSPPGDNAGFAAIRRQRNISDGRANFGVNGYGTLDNPLTAAVSPDFADKYRVCQGDLLYDPRFGWLRVEGGSTSKTATRTNSKGKAYQYSLGKRVDVWRNNESVNAANASGINFTHFPAGLVDKKFAETHPGGPPSKK